MNREAQVPALCELMGIEYTGSDAACMAVTLNKATAKRLVAQDGILTPAFAVLLHGQGKAAQELHLPRHREADRRGQHQGHPGEAGRRGRGRRCATSRTSLIRRYRQPVLAEAFLPGREFTVAMLGERKPRVLPIMEIVFTDKDDPLPHLHVQEQVRGRGRREQGALRRRPAAAQAARAHRQGRRSRRSAAATSRASICASTAAAACTSSSAIRCPAWPPTSRDLCMMAKAENRSLRAAGRARSWRPRCAALRAQQARASLRRGLNPGAWCFARGRTRPLRRLLAGGPARFDVLLAGGPARFDRACSRANPPEFCSRGEPPAFAFGFATVHDGSRPLCPCRSVWASVSSSARNSGEHRKSLQPRAWFAPRYYPTLPVTPRGTRGWRIDERIHRHDGGGRRRTGSALAAPLQRRWPRHELVIRVLAFVLGMTLAVTLVESRLETRASKRGSVTELHEQAVTTLANLGAARLGDDDFRRMAELKVKLATISPALCADFLSGQVDDKDLLAALDELPAADVRAWFRLGHTCCGAGAHASPRAGPSASARACGRCRGQRHGRRGRRVVCSSRCRPPQTGVQSLSGISLARRASRESSRVQDSCSPCTSPRRSW